MGKESLIGKPPGFNAAVCCLTAALQLAGSAVAEGIAQPRFTRAWRALGDPRRLVLQALEIESAERRLFLWLPVAAGSGVVFYLLADREPSLWLAAALALVSAVLAFLLRGRRLAYSVSIGLCCLCLGLLSASWRTARVAAPVIDRIKVVTLEGFVEEMDLSPYWRAVSAAAGESRRHRGRRAALSRASHAQPHPAVRGRYLCAAEGAASAARPSEPA